MSETLSQEKKIKIVLLFGKYENAEEVRRDWKNHFESEPPARSTIHYVVNKFKETGSVHDRPRSGRPLSIVNEEVSQEVTELLTEDPYTSIRLGALQLEMSKSNYQRILEKLDYHSYRPSKTIELTDDDFDRRVEFCETFLGMAQENPDLPGKIVWSDESQFKLNGVVNRHNCCYWVHSNQHHLIPVPHDQHGVMTWCGITSKKIIGPYFFEGNVNGDSYNKMLEEFLWPQVKHRCLYFQQDGAPAHYATKVRSWLDEKFNGRWIGRRGPIEWPARSPDLTPCDFFLWGYLKNIVYKERSATLEELRDRIKQACAEIPVEVLYYTCENVVSRFKRCHQAGGVQQL